MDATEILTKWQIVDGITFDFISAEVFSSYPELSVRLIDGRRDVSEHRDLVFQFTRVVAFTLHEEFVHPTQGTVWGREPFISEDNKMTFPCLIVTGSKWYASLGLKPNYEGAVHYRLCTNLPVVDIVSLVVPTVSWMTRPKTEQEYPPPAWVTASTFT